MAVHVVIWLFVFIMGLSVYLCNGDRGTFSKICWVGFQISLYFGAFSLLAGAVKVFIMLLGY